jgi:uncharacterized protein YmfQ (DUF2313 family)
MEILDHLGEALLDEMGAGRHRWVLQQLTPLALGATHVTDMIVEGAHLDQAEDHAAELLEEMFPDSAEGLLDDWERLLGLPDPCTGRPVGLAARQAAAAAKWGEKRSLASPYLVSVAGLLGIAVTVTSYAARRYGQARMGGRYQARRWATSLTVHAPGLAAEQRLYLECAISRLRPAHTYLHFDYEEV